MRNLNLNLKPKPKRFRFKRHKDLLAYWIERWMKRQILKYIAMQKRMAVEQAKVDWLDRAKQK